jgi:hypothetical protein
MTVSTALRVRASDDYTGQLLLKGLSPDTSYRYRIGHDQRGPLVRGWFQTAPEDDAHARVRLAFGGDVAGQNVCRAIRVPGWSICSRYALARDTRWPPLAQVASRRRRVLGTVAGASLMSSSSVR